MKNTDQQIIDYISKNPGSTGAQLASDLGISQSSASRKLSDLMARDLIIKSGNTRSSAYFLDKISAHLHVDINSRPNAPYSADAFGKIRGNLFSEKELSSMHAAGKINDELSTKSIQVYKQFILDLSFNSSKFEGNLYTYIDTQALLNYSEYAKDKPQTDGVMILNHKDALEYLLEGVSEIGVDLYTIKDVHSLLSKNLPGVTLEERGACRTRIVQMNGSTFIPLNEPHEIPRELNRLIDISNTINDPIDKSLFLLAAIPYLQAFVDVNKRVGRLMASVPLIKAGLAPFSFSSMSKADYTKGIISVYELQDITLLKKAYLSSYLKSAPAFSNSLDLQSMNKVNPLEIKYASEIEKAVAFVIKNKKAPDIIGIDEADKKNVENIIVDTLKRIHPDAAASYKVKRSELSSFELVRDITIEDIKKSIGDDSSPR